MKFIRHVSEPGQVELPAGMALEVREVFHQQNAADLARPSNWQLLKVLNPPDEYGKSAFLFQTPVGKRIVLKIMQKRNPLKDPLGTIRHIRRAQTIGFNVPDYPGVFSGLLHLGEKKFPFIAHAIVEIDGEKLENAAQNMRKPDLKELVAELMQQIRLLHQNGGTHGDLNCSNIVVEKGTGKAFFIDNESLTFSGVTPKKKTTDFNSFLGNLRDLGLTDLSEIKTMLMQHYGATDIEADSFITWLERMRSYSARFKRNS